MLEKAMELLSEHRKEYVFYNHNQKAAFVQRLRRLAAKVECKVEDNFQVVLTLDVIATRCNVYLRYKDEANAGSRNGVKAPSTQNECLKMTNGPKKGQ